MTVTEAAEVAKSKLIEVMPELSIKTLRLEEVETPPQSSRWKFTFSAVLPMKDLPNGAAAFYELMQGRRLTKSVEIDTQDGSLLAIRNAA